MSRKVRGFAAAPMPVRPRVALGVLLALAPCSAAQTYLTYSEVPYVSTQSPTVFQNLFTGARSHAVRAVMLGDSQETSPGGQGVRYMPRLNYEFFRRYANAPETPLTGVFGSTGGGAPWGDWLVRLFSAAPGPSPSRLPLAQLPPNSSPATCSTTSGNNVNNNQWYGCLVMLQHDAHDTDPAAMLHTGTEYFKRGTDVYLDVYAATNASSGEIVCRVTPSPTHAPSYYRPTTATLTSNLGLQSPTPALLRHRFGPLAFAGQPYMQVELYGSDPARLTDLIAAQFIGTVDPSGWSISSMSAGGYTATSLVTNHPGWLDLLRTFAPNVAFLAYGANDAANGRSPQAFHDDLGAIIAQLRAALGPGFPVIILGDPRRDIQVWNADTFDRYAGVAHALAQELTNVCAVNTRRLTEEHLWDGAHLNVFTSDGVHYSPAGAALKAALEAQALFDAFDPTCVLPTFDQNPSDASICAGAAVAFSVSASGDPAPTYQWRRNALPLLDSPGRVAGATSPTLTLSALTNADAGAYDCVASNTCGDMTSAAASLTIVPRCPADLENGTLTGTPDGGVDISDLLYFLAQYELGAATADLDDGSMTGTPDAGVDISDLIYFLVHYEGGC